jgi:hypothetical protein
MLTQSKAERIRKKAAYRTEKRQGKIVLGVLFFILAAYYVYDHFWGYLQFGGNRTYHLLVHVTPLVLGVGSIAWWVRSDFKKIFSPKEKLQNVLASLFLIVILGAGIGFVVFLLPAQIIWDRVNLAAALKGPSIASIGPVTEFKSRKSKGSQSGIGVRVHGRLTRIPASRSFMADYRNEDPAHYNVALTLRKGLLETWIIEDWDLYRKD